MSVLETSITAVTVFNDQARITRTGVIDLDEGEHTLVLADLPLTLIPESVRASGQGAGVTLLGVDVKTEYLAEMPEQEIADLQAQIDALRERDTRMADEDRVLNERLEWLRQLATSSGESFARSLSYGRTSLEALSELGDYLAAETDRANAQRRKIARRRRDLKHQIDALERRLAQIRNPRSTTRYEIHVGVRVDAPVELVLEVEYGVWQASWQPVYDLRLEDSAIWLTYMATVSQTTGEDWPEVALALSTARPGTGTALPELPPWYVDQVIYHPVAYAPQAKRAGGLAMATAVLAAPVAAADAVMRERAEAEEYAAPAPPPAAMQQAVIEPPAPGGGSTGAVTYRITRPVEIPSDGTPHHTTITIQELKVELDYLTVPKLAEEAHLRAEVTNTSDFILLPGEVSLFNGADFVGKTWINLIAPGEDFKARLGVDDRIRIERKLVKREVSKVTLKNIRRTEFAYRIKLTNLLDAPAKVTLQDQIPVGRHEQIKAKLLSASPEPTEQTDLNVLTWELTIPRGEKREVTFTFSVEHPRDMPISGLGV